MNLAQYPSNSNKNRENTVEKRKVEPVIDRVPEVRNQSNFKRFVDNFIVSDMNEVREYVVMKVMLPRLKSMFLAMLQNGAEVLVNGPNAANNRNNNYNNYSKQSNSYGTMRYENRPTCRSTNYVPYPEPLLETEDEVLDIMDEMKNHADKFGLLSISEFLGFCNRPVDDEYTYNNYGWFKDAVFLCQYEQIPDGRFVIKLPKPRYLK